VARQLLAGAPAARIVFAGSERAIDGGILDREGFELVRLPAASSADLRRRPAAFLRNNWRAWKAARALIKSLAPSAVIGCGGYASAAPALAARRSGIPLVLLEQNVVPGRATGWLSRCADRVCVSFEETPALLPRLASCIVTGNPVRAEIAQLADAATNPGTPRKLLVLGGSQGARTVNELMTDFAEKHISALRQWSLLHQTGQADFDDVRSRYAALPLQVTTRAFIEDMAAVYGDATLVVARAGATTLAELACCGVPALLLPHRHAIRDHQRRNAEHYAAAGAAEMVLETGNPANDGELLARELRPLLDDADRLADMSAAMRRLARPHAAAAVCDVIAEITGGPS
jgi:UDP-N-acetylglucosamine--N-acetylmuramyl-(pentapeptide) pyrophosphoryl-undecaprenol N-acetylglucosamine transferase